MKMMNIPGMRETESSTFYKTKGNTIVARKSTRSDQRAQEEKKAMLLYSQTYTIRRGALPVMKERTQDG